MVEEALFEAPPGCLLEGTGDGEHVLAVDYLGIGRGTGARYEDGVRLAELGSNWFKRVYRDGEAADPFEALVPLAGGGTLIRFSPDRRHVT